MRGEDEGREEVGREKRKKGEEVGGGEREEREVSGHGGRGKRNTEIGEGTGSAGRKGEECVDAYTRRTSRVSSTQGVIEHAHVYTSKPISILFVPTIAFCWERERGKERCYYKNYTFHTNWYLEHPSAVEVVSLTNELSIHTEERGRKGSHIFTVTLLKCIHNCP